MENIGETNVEIKTTEKKEKKVLKKRKISKILISKRLRLPLIFLVIVFHFISCICIGLVIALYSFPLNDYTDDEIAKYENIANAIVYSGVNKLNYYSIDLSATSDGIDIGRIYTKGIKNMEYDKFKMTITMNNFVITQIGSYIYFTPQDARKDFSYIARYHINTGKMDFTNSYIDIRFNYILKWNIILSALCFILIVIIYSLIGVFRPLKK